MSQTFCPECGRVHEPDPGACPRPSLVGQTLPGGILVRERVGATSMGVIYHAESTDTQCELQLVFLTGPKDREPTPLRAQLTRAAAITHPNVAAVKTIGDTPDGVPYVAFEVIRGELLSEMLQDRSVLPIVEAVDLILQAAAGLQAAHEAGLLHGNLSPETILVTSGDEGRPLAKLIRFGLTEPEPEPSRPAETVARYAAPERLAGHPPSISGDVFSLGAMLYHMLSGQPPDAARNLWGGLPSCVRAALTGALDPMPEHRFKSVAVFSQFLQGCGVDGEPSEQRQVPRRLAGWRSRAALAGTVAAIAAGVAWLAVRGEHGAEPGLPPSDGSVAAVRTAPSPAPAAVDTLPDAAATGAKRFALRAAARSARSSSARSVPAPQPQKPKPEAVAARPSESAVPRLLIGDKSRASPALGERPPTIVPEPPERTVSPPPAPAPPQPVSPKPAMTVPRDAMAETREAAGRTLATYARALESNDLHAVEWIYPRITDRERTAWKKFFRVARDLAVTLNIERLALSGSEAHLDVEGTYRYWNRTMNRQEEAPVRFLATVRRDGDTWHLSAIR
jgi:eukaryotic-like serine/threonine-protein kinase